jgi:hypothetical protein
MYIDKANVKEQPDWTREKPRRFWGPSWNLLKSIKKQLSTSVILTLIAFLLSFLTFAAHAALPKTSEGWTIFNPSKDSLIVYVSNDGDDETAKKYTKKQLGNSPFTPPENMVLPSFKTFKAAFEKTRKNKPDWILVKRGDNFFDSIDVRNGKSLTEPFLTATYGEDYANPIFNTGAEKALNKCCHSLSDIVIQGLDFYAHTRDPKSPLYFSAAGDAGINLYVNKGNIIKNFLIEGNCGKFYVGNVIQGPGSFDNIATRRNSFLDHYSTDSHSGGLYTENVNIKLEENIFDHIGWLIQASEIAGKEQGAATMFNHNTYFANARNVEFINNIFIRSSRIHNKWTANEGPHSSSDIIIKNNLYVDREIGISAGGNKAGADRFKNYQITDNVMLNIGHSQPTGRTLSWGLEIKDWDRGIVKNNYFLNQVNSQVTNTYGVKISGITKNVEIENNKFDDLFSANAIVLGTGGSIENIAINNNQFTFKENGDALIKVENDLTGYSFKNNQYFHEVGPQKTHVNNTTSVFFWQTIFPRPKNINFVEWITLTKELESQWHKSIASEKRTIESYLKSINKKPSIDVLTQELRNMQ